MRTHKTKDIAEIALLVSALLVGGFAIYFTLGQFPFPGVKYVMMAPYVSCFMAFIVAKEKNSQRYVMVNAVFALTMMGINLYMGFAILVVTGLTYVLYKILERYKWRSYFIGSSYALFTVGISMVISKYIIGNAMFRLLNWQIACFLLVLSIALGIVGAYVGIQIHKRFR